MGRVLHVVSSTDRRGAEIFGLQLHEAMRRRGWDSNIVALAGGGGSGLEIECLGSSRRHPSTLLALRKRAVGYSVVVAHGSTTLPACAVSLAAGGPPFVYRNIGDPHHWVTTPGRRLRVALLLRRAELVVALTTTTAERMQSMYRLEPDRLTVIPTGVPLEDFPPATPKRRAEGRRHLGVPQDVPLVLYLGALEAVKRVGDIVEAIHGLGDVHLVIAGDGAERDRLSSLALASSERIRIVGPTCDPGLFLAAADVVVLASETEGLPGVLVEAGMVGVPVVATDVGFVGDIVTDDAFGTLVRPNDITALSEAIRQRLLRQAPLPGNVSQRLRQQFGLEHVVTAWQEALSPWVGS